VQSPSQYLGKAPLALAVILFLVVGGQLSEFFHDYRSLTQSSSARADIPNDFPGYYVAAQIARNPRDHRLYYLPGNPLQVLLGNAPKDTPWTTTARTDGFNSTLPFNCPPFAAWLLQPLSFFSWPVALLLWRIALLGMLLLSVYLALLIAGGDNLLLHFVLVATAALSFFPSKETLFQGQLDPLILLTWVAGVYLQKVNRPVWSALLFAIGTVVKVSPIAVVGIFLLRRQWKWLASYAAWCAILMGISISRLGWENHVIWAMQVMPVLSRGAPYFANKSIAGLLYEVYLRRVPLQLDFQIPGLLTRVASLLNLCIYGGTLIYFWWKNRVANAIVYELVVMALTALAMSPLVWRHYYVLALLPLIVLWLRPGNDRWEWLVLAVSTLAIGTVFVDYVIVAVRHPVLDILSGGVIPLATLALLFLLLRHYPAVRREVFVPTRVPVAAYKAV